MSPAVSNSPKWIFAKGNETESFQTEILNRTSDYGNF
jgi:hypothetical protein